MARPRPKSSIARTALDNCSMLRNAGSRVLRHTAEQTQESVPLSETASNRKFTVSFSCSHDEFASLRKFPQNLPLFAIEFLDILSKYNRIRIVGVSHWQWEDGLIDRVFGRVDASRYTHK